jgi:hypothetical protein
VPHPEKPSYEELATRVAELLAVVAQQGALIESLRAEVAALRRQGRPGLLELLAAAEPGRLLG